MDEIERERALDQLAADKRALHAKYAKHFKTDYDNDFDGSGSAKKWAGGDQLWQKYQREIACIDQHIKAYTNIR
jgi:hypothetical protein